jgi:hypothetical protein
MDNFDFIPFLGIYTHGANTDACLAVDAFSLL